RARRAEARNGIAARLRTRWLCGCESAGHAGALFRSWGQIEMEFGPACPRKGPFMLAAPFESAPPLADCKPHRRLSHHAVVDALEPVIEETNLIAAAVLGVERMHM